MNKTHNMIDRQHLRVIAAIDQHGTLTEAANHLHLTQSALSHGMKKVEQAFNTPMWVKDGRRLRLTQAGESLLALARRVLPQFEHTEQQLQQLAEGKQGILRIGMECHPCYQWLLRVISPFLQQFADVDVDIRQAFTFGGLQALHGYDIDVLLTPDPLYLRSVDYTPVFHYQQALVIANNHPLAEKTWIQPDDLATQTLLTYPVEASRLDIFAQFLTPAGGSVHRHRHVENTEILLQMVSAVRGVAALPKWLVDEAAPALNLTTRPLGKNGLAKTLFMGTRRTDTHPQYLNRFIEMARQQGGVA